MIDSCILSYINTHHLAQLFQKSLLQLQSMKKWDSVSILLQKEQVLHILIFIFFNY